MPMVRLFISPLSLSPSLSVGGGNWDEGRHVHADGRRGGFAGSVESINTSNQTAQQLESRVNSTVMRQEVNSVLREAGYTEGVFLRDVLLDSPYYPSEKSRMYLYGLDGADEPAAPPRPEPTNHSGSS